MAYTARVEHDVVQDGGDMLSMALLVDGRPVRSRIMVFVPFAATLPEARALVEVAMAAVIAQHERTPRFNVGQELTLP